MDRAAARFAALIALLSASLVPSALALVIDGGVDNTVAISSHDATVWAWGGNVGGKLGNGTTINSSMPVPVRRSWNIGIATGKFHGCIWDKLDGSASCWGSNSFGQLGDGTLTDRHIPTSVSGLSGPVTSLATGANHTCALLQSGTVQCWGSNGNSQLGLDSSTLASAVPVTVSGLSSVVAIAAGLGHTCALTAAGAVKCWGRNFQGQLGDQSTTQRTSPVQVFGLSSGVVAIAAGDEHTCAIQGLELVCWGSNSNGQLGVGTSGDFSTVTVAASFGDARAVAAGGANTCAITSGGGAWCWGRNDSGQVGNGFTGDDVVLPDTVSGLSGDRSVAAITTGAFHSCAITSTRALKCWGYNGPVGGNLGGALGNNSTTNSAVPVLVQNLPVAGAASAGFTFTCGLKRDPGHGGNSLQCWGANFYGQLGDGTQADKLVPAFVKSGADQPLDATAVSAGMSHTLGLRSDGTVWAWGANDKGQLGLGQDGGFDSCLTRFDFNGPINCSTSAMQVPGLTNVVAIGTGWGHSLALKQDGTVWAWGNNDYGQLGSGAPGTSFVPLQVNPLTKIAKIAVGYFHNVALTGLGHPLGQGHLLAWGRRNHGQLGDNQVGDDSSFSASPVTVLKNDLSSIDSVTAISSKGLHTLALRGGNVWAWGLNAYGQVGNGTLGEGAAGNVSTAVQVLSNASEISAGMSTSMARGTGISAWGLDTLGQLGIAPNPAPQPPLDNCDSSQSACNSSGSHVCAAHPRALSYANPLGAAAGGAHGIVTRSDDTLALFGDNAAGQLGDRSGNFDLKQHFSQASFDPDSCMFPGLTDASGTAIGASPSGSGLSPDNLGASIDFGSVNVGSAKSVTLILTNLDPSPIAISCLTASTCQNPSGPFAVVNNLCTGAIAANGGSCQFDLQFTASAPAATYGTLEIDSTAVNNEVLRYGIVATGVSVATPPGAPQGLAATPGNGSATFTFSPPASNGGSPITGYTITCPPLSVSGTAPPLTLSGMTNGVTYTCSATATNAVGTGPASPTVNVTPSASAPPFSLVSALSRHQQGLSGVFTISIDITQAIGGNVTVEPRAIGSGHTVVLNFGTSITSTGTVACKDAANANVGTCNASASGNTVVVSIPSMPDRQRATISLANVNGVGVNASVSVLFLKGDVNGSRSVTASDILVNKGLDNNVSATSSNFRNDVDNSGLITAADLTAIKANSGFSSP
jgi:alpha-tubulin suppressor-like RCC1 family protein